MKKICIATYVYGEKYQSFIPIYIYSILKSYPDYYIRIYVDNKLLSNVKEQLALLNKLGDFEVVENFHTKLKISPELKSIEQVSRCFRWLMHDEIFLEFDSIYIGDIDIFICRENPGLYEQHIKHCEFLNLPYSNCVRTRKLNKSQNIKFIARALVKFGIKETLKYYRDSRSEIKRLTGLHFIKTTEYYAKIAPVIPKLQTSLGDLANKNSTEWNQVMFNNEFFLYELIVKSGIGVPKELLNGAINDSSDYYSYSFRPHHGLHLGIFRDILGARKEHDLITGQIYINYYKQFCELRNNDDLFKEIQVHFSPYLNQIINNMDEYYGSYGLIPSALK
ncbi:hypothetical protein [Lederbergia panacisoli]|uniref:hypothetical protein n=1 Tax=Lederbergia panacisoli TaxID=1255251 RepID=UPI00214C4342|nr:hypothetical protein [Lederbergia panacisoli]MCR2823820.1 hypothetical protein [Lederbergia panacisoli]